MIPLGRHYGPRFWRWWARGWVVFCLVAIVWDTYFAITGHGFPRWLSFGLIVWTAAAAVTIVWGSMAAGEASADYRATTARMDASIERLRRLERGEDPGPW